MLELLEGGSVRLEVERRRTLRELKGSLPARGRYPLGRSRGREAARDCGGGQSIKKTLGRARVLLGCGGDWGHLLGRCRMCSCASFLPNSRPPPQKELAATKGTIEAA